MRQTSLFDTPRPLAQPTGEQLKQEGMQRAAESKASLVGHMRGLALGIAKGELPHADGEFRADGLVTLDDIYVAWEYDNEQRRENGEPEIKGTLGNAAGQVLAGLKHMWRFTGVRVKSQRAQSHANELKQWELIDFVSPLVEREGTGEDS